MFRFAQHDKGNARFNRSRSGVRRDSGPFGPKDCLLKVLDLLSDLLQFGLAADDSLGDRSIIRFCSERVEFAKNLLRNELQRDRKSTRLNSSHSSISYAVFCLK